MDVGGRLRAAREARGLSQRELANQAGLTGSAISLIEQNKSSPSVASLKRILSAIQMNLSDFFIEVESADADRYFHRAEDLTELSPQDLGFGEGAGRVSLRQVGDVSKHVLQMLHETYPPGADTGPELLSHEGEEVGIVISGAIEVTVADRVQVLGAGDGYLFDSRLPHRFRNLGRAACVVVSACTPPSF